MKTMKTFVAFLAGAALFTACNQVPKTGKMEFKNQLDSVSYALGYIEANQVKKQFEQVPFTVDSTTYVDLAKVFAKSKLQERYLTFRKDQFGDLNEDAFFKGFLNEFAYGKSHFTEMSADVLLRKVFTEMRAQKDSLKKQEAVANLEKGQKFLEENKKRPEIKVTESGLQYEVIREGNGPVAGPTDQVKCQYHGTLLDGTVFDSSVDRGDTTQFRVNGVIKGWTEALQLMPAGSKWRLYIPSDLAYGERGTGDKIGANSALIFDLDLFEVMSAEKQN